MKERIAKLVVKDAEGELIQICPEVKGEAYVSAISDAPVSGKAVAAWGARLQRTVAQSQYPEAYEIPDSNIDLSKSTVFTKTINDDTTFTISNAPAGKSSQFILILEDGGSEEVAWPNSVTWASGREPVLSESGTNVLRFVSPDGENWLGCMDGTSSKEVGYFTNEPTAANSAELDNEAFIFQQVSTSPTTAFQGFVHLNGNESISGAKTFIDPITGSLSGNASTASALATARTISLTGEATGSASFNGSADAAISTTLGSTIAGNKTFSGNLSIGGDLSIAGNPTCGNDEIIHVPNSAAAHNAIYRGKDLTEVYTLAQLSEKLANGDFSDLFIGDYITYPFSYINEDLNIEAYKSVNFRFAHFNYWINKGYKESGSTYGELTANHIFLVPDEPLFTAYMNATNTAAGGLKGTWLWGEMQDAVATALNEATCLNSHVIPHSNIISNGINDMSPSGGCSGWFGIANAWKWYDEYVMFINEVMAFGATTFSSSGYDVGAGDTQLALFHLDPSWLNSKSARSSWWLGAVASGSAFCNVNGQGRSHNTYASNPLGVRPGLLFA